MASRWRGAVAVAVAAALGAIGGAWGQNPAQQPAAGKAAAKKAGLRAAGGAPPKGARKDAADPLARDEPLWPFHFRLRIAAADGTPLAVSYYPSKLRANAPVIMLIHERGLGRSRKDFEQPLDDLKGQSLAEYLQESEYAVLVPDLRGHNPRRELSAREWQASVADLQSAYLFLVDRHNRRELNLAKLGVLAVGESANLAAAWAASPGAAVSSEGRISDLSALALISPVDDAQGLRLAPAVAALAPRVPILLAAGKRGAEPVKAAQVLVERHQRSRVVLFDSPLSGNRLLTLFPGVASTAARFFDEPVKSRTAEWDGRYLLTPVAFSDVEFVSPKGEQEARPKRAAAKKGEPEK